MIFPTWVKLGYLLAFRWFFDGHDLSGLECRSFRFERLDEGVQYRAECSTPQRAYACISDAEDDGMNFCYTMRLK